MSVFTPVIVQADLPPTAAANSVPETPLGEAPNDATVTNVYVVSEAALTADNTNNRTLSVFNRGQNGAGTLLVATLQTNVAGGNWVANDRKDFVLSATPANLVVNALDTFECVETIAGTGVVRSACEITVRGTHR